MKRIFIIIFILLNALWHCTGLEVDVDEIKVGKKIKFINYEGKHTHTETIWDIRAIGKWLSRITIDNEIFRYHMKYSIIHALDDTTNDLFDADIFSIDKNAKVDHIRNIRLIISCYLEKKYGYTKKDALLLTTFVIYYNAIYRGNIDYFSKKYKKCVMRHINE
ncbi:MAG: hypothetical protein KAT05_17875, partial [Spirochaetes bacterium]|nr:hypothetical protein [Spirochaetota bacterium]